jgi:hypothetical protein
MVVALPQALRAKVRFLFGYTGLAANRDPRTYGPVVPYGIHDGISNFEANMRSILDQDSYDIVVDLLDEIDESRVNIRLIRKTIVASAVEGAVKLNKNRMRELWAEDYKLCKQLSNYVGVPVYDHPSYHDGYGTVGVRGG